MAFPATPTNGQIISVNSVNYIYSSATNSWARLTTLNVGSFANVTANGYISATGNITSNSSIIATGFYFANGAPFTSSNYGNANVDAYLGSYYTYANANASTQATAINSINANIGAYQTYANANAASQTTAFNTLDANVGSYQIWANTNISSLQSNAAFQANLIDVLTGNAATQGSALDILVANAATQANTLTSLLSNAAAQEASLTTLVSNAAGQSTAIDTINANIGAYQIYANANAASQQTEISTLQTQVYSNTNVSAYLSGNITTGNVSAVGYYFANGMPFVSGTGGGGTYGNVDVATYLPTYTGNLNPGNITATGNIVGGGVRTTTSATKPTNPSPGDMWYDTSIDTLFRYSDLGGARSWVDITGLAVEVTLSNDVNAQITSYLAGNIIVGNVRSSGYYWADGSPFITGMGSVDTTANVTMSTNHRYICNTAVVAITLSLPGSATLGDEVGIIDGTGNCNVNNITVSRNGHKIQGLAEDLTVSTSRAAFTLVYYNADQGWLLTQV